MLHGCPPALLASPTIPDHPATLSQDLENPVDVPVGWLHRGDTRGELSGDEDEAPRGTEGPRAPGRAGGRGGEQASGLV